jgi:PAS domain S-box-containing protein
MIKIFKPTKRLLVISLLSYGALILAFCAQCWAAETIKVGIFQNKPIVYFEDHPDGLFVEVLDYVAQKENWKIEYVECELKECLRLLKSNELDLMTSMGESPERLAIFSFSKEPIWTFWGTVYSHDHSIHGIFDLRGKKIGVRRANKITSGLQTLLSEFNIPVEYTEYDNYESAYEAFTNEKIDVIAVNNTYGFDKQNEIPAYKTPIVFNPFSAYFAAPKNGRHVEKLAVIDKYVKLLKADEASLLHAFNLKWFGGKPQGILTAKNISLISAIIIILTIFGMAIWRYFSIMKINKDLSQNILERKRAEIALQQAHSELEKRVEDRTKDLREEIENRKILERELSKEKTFLEAVLNNIEDGIVACNQEGVLTLFNRATREFHGLPEKPIPAEQWADHYDLYLADGRTKMCKDDIPLFRALQGEDVKNVEFVIAPKHGEKRFLQAAGQQLVDSNNSLIGAVASMHDVTEQKKAEHLLLNAHQELEKKVEERTMELKLSYGKLEHEIAEREKAEAALRQSHKMEAIGTLAGGIAHDFNNILAAVLGYADMAMDDIPARSPAKYQIEQVLKAGNRAKDLVKHILSFSRKENHILIPVDVLHIAKESLKFLRATIPTTIDIKEHFDIENRTILADETQIHQVIVNLCTNAAQAMDVDGGILEVTLSDHIFSENDVKEEPDLQPGEYVHLCVRDNGTGIDPKYLDKIFDPYFTTKEVGKGSGMGLAVVIGIVKSHGGVIRVNSKLGEGTSFNVYLPKVEEQIHEEIDETIPLPHGSEKILVVDDDASIVDMTQQRLERLGYNVTAKTSSKEALTLFRAKPDAFDLVISDQTMPGLTGEQLAKELLAIRPDIPIIICTGYSSKMDAEKANFVGVSAFIMKPVDKRELAITMRKVLDSRC